MQHIPCRKHWSSPIGTSSRTSVGVPLIDSSMITDAWRAYFQYVLRTGPIRARATFYEHDDLPIWPVTCWQSQRSWGCCCHMGMRSTVMAWLSVLLQWFMSCYHQSIMEMIHDDSRVPLTSDHLVWCHPLLWICLMEQLNGPNLFFVILVTSCTCPSAALYTTEARKRSKVTLQNWLVDTMYIYIYIYIIFNFLSAEVKTPKLINLWICPEAEFYIIFFLNKNIFKTYAFWKAPIKTYHDGRAPPPWTNTPDLCNFFAMDKLRFTAIQCTILVCFNSTQRNCASLHPLRLLWHPQSCNSVNLTASVVIIWKPGWLPFFVGSGYYGFIGYHTVDISSWKFEARRWM